MKTLKSDRAAVWFAGVVAAVVGLAATSFAPRVAFGQATYYWDSNGVSAGFGTGAGTWGASSFWSTSSAGTLATSSTTTTSSDAVNFGTASLSGPATVNVATGGVTVGSIIIGGSQSAMTLGTAGNNLTIHGGITKNAGSGQLTLGSPIVLGAAQTWINSSTTAVSYGTINLNGNRLTVEGVGTVQNSASTSIISGSGGITVNSGRFWLGASSVPAHTYSGDTNLNGGVTMFSANLSANSNINMNGGILESYWTGVLTRGLGTAGNQLRITGGESGFSMNGSNGATFNLGTTVTWGDVNFNPSKFVLQSQYSQGGSALTFSSNINLGGANRTILVNSGATGNATSTLSGTISTSGTAGLIKEGAGYVVLTSASNTYNGGTTINAGTLAFDKIAAMPSSGAVTVNDGATLGIDVGAAGDWTSGTSGVGTLGGLLSGTGGAGTSTVSYNGNVGLRLNMTGTAAYSSNIANVGTSLAITKVGNFTLTLSGSNTYSGGTILSAGTLAIGHNNALGTGTVSLNGGTTIQSSDATARTVSNPIAIGGDFTVGGTGNLTFSSSGAVALAANRTITVTGGTASFAQSFSGAGFGINKAGAGTLVLSGSNTYTSVTTTNNGGGTLVFSGTAAMGSGALQVQSGTGTFQIQQDGGFSMARGVQAFGTGGVNNIVVDRQTAGSGSGSNYQFTSANTNNDVAATATVNFSAGPNVTSGVPTVTFTQGIRSQSVNVGSNNVTLNASGVDLRINGLSIGSTGRTRNWQLGGTSTGSEVYGNIEGTSNTATVTKNGVGTWLLSGSNSYTGATTISGGRLHVGSAGRINGTSGVTVNGSGAEFKYNSATAYTQPLTVTQGTVSGTGTISASGGVSIGTNAVISPGNSPGSQSYTTGLTWAQGGSYLWEINDWTGAAGSAYDQVVVTGSALDVTATSGSTFTINITSLSGTAAGGVSNWSDTNKTFTIATALSGGGVTNFAANKFSLVSSQFLAQNPGATGTWSISTTGSTVLLNYAPAYASTTYTLGASASAAAILVGGTSSITATVTNTGTGIADSLGVTGLGVTVSPSGSVALSPTSGTASNGNGTVVGSGDFTSGVAGSYEFTPTVTSATNVNLGGAASATGTTTTTVTVLAHSSASLASGVSPVTSTTISLGRWNWQTSAWEVGSGSNAFSLYNLSTTTPASLTAALDVTGTSVTGDAGFSSTLTLASYSLISGGTFADYYASFAPSGTTSGTFSATFTFQTADENLPGKTAGTPVSVTATVVVVPEPGTIALAGIGIALAGWAFARRRR